MKRSGPSRSIRGGSTIAYMGLMLAYAGDWEGGCALVERATQLNPQHHPGWYWFCRFFDAYRKGEYLAALNGATMINIPDYFFTQGALAAAHRQLGNRHAAREALSR